MDKIDSKFFFARVIYRFKSIFSSIPVRYGYIADFCKLPKLCSGSKRHRDFDHRRVRMFAVWSVKHDEQRDSS